MLRAVLLTALNLLPSMATNSFPNNSAPLHHTRNCTSTRLIASPFSCRNRHSVLKSGCNCPLSHINSTLRPHSCSNRRDDRTRFRWPQMKIPNSTRGSYPGRPVSAGSPRTNPNSSKARYSMNASIARTTLFSSRYSSKLRGNNTLCPRAVPLI